MYERQADYEKDLTAAKDPNTDAKTLGELVYKHHGELELVHAVAQNPSCPLKMFIDFWRFCKEVAAKNPAVENHQKHPDWSYWSRRKPRTRASRYSSEVSLSAPQIHKLPSH